MSTIFGREMKEYYRSSLLIFVLLLSVKVAYSQPSVSFMNKDTSAYPLIKAEVFFFNNSFVPDLSVTKNDIVIKENGQDIPLKTYNCPSLSPYRNLSLVLSFDLATDTSGAGQSNFQLAKSACRSIIQKINIDNTECAATSFDIFSYLNCDYTNDRTKLLNSIDKITHQSASAYNASFLSKPAGSLEIASLGNYPKSIIVISDRIGYVDVDSVVNFAKKISAKIFWIKIDGKLTNEIKNISLLTGGFYFENIIDEDDLNKAINHILSMSYGYQPCEISWESISNCDSIKLVTVETHKYPANDEFFYYAPMADMPRLMLDPPYLGYSAVMPGFTRDLPVRMKAVNSDIIVNQFRIMPPFSIVAGDVSGNELRIKKGEEHTVTVRFSPQDSAMVYTMLDIVGNACYGRHVIITGGFPNVPPKQRTLSLDAPSCDETLIIGDTFLIQWSGLLPGDVVQLEYSIDGGNSWDPIANDVTGLVYKWEVPNLPTKECLIRVIQLWPNNVGETLNFYHKGGVNSARFSSRPSEYIITASRDKLAQVWNANTGWLLCELKGHDANVNWANFDQSGEYAVTASDDKTVKVWKFNSDYSNAELIHTLTGHRSFVKAANFSFNGQSIVSAGSDGMVIVWDRETGKALDTLADDPGTQQWYASYSPSGNKIITSGSKGRAVVYNAYSGNSERVFSTGNSGETINFVTYSPNEKYICTATTFGKATVWDTNSGDTLFSVDHTDDDSRFPTLTCADFSFSGDFLLTSSFNHTARMWDAATGKLIMPMVEHTGPVQSIMFNFDASRILTASMDSVAKVWNLDKRDLQGDTTDCLLTIGSPRIASKNIDFGPVLLDEVKDSLITDFIVNLSDFQFTIKEIKILGANPNDFTIKNGFAPYKIDTASSASCLISFQPLAIGDRKAIVRIIIPLDTIEIELKGKGIEPGLALASKYIDFGKVQIGDIADTTLSMIVQNRSSINNIKIKSIYISGPDFLHFSILEGNNPIELKPGQSTSMRLRFLPEYLERTSSGISIEYDAPGSPATIYLIGEGISPVIDTITLAVGSVNAAPGSIIEVPVYVKSLANNKYKQNISGFTGDMTFNASLLEPLDTQYPSRINDNFRTIRLELPSEFSDDSVLTTLRFRAALGNAQSTELKLSNTAPIGTAKVVIYEKSGVFSLDGVCFEGGKRLLEMDARFSLHQNKPNPVETSAIIEFDAGEPGSHRVFVADMLGNTVKVLLNQNILPGSYTLVFHSAGLPAGRYFYILQTPSQMFTRTLEIVR